MQQRMFEAEPGPEWVAGVDEVGRGCLAGPVVAGAVILPEVYALPGLTDSKAMTEAARNTLEPEIRRQAVAWGLGVVWPGDIDRINILQATFLAMRRAVAGAAARMGAVPRLVLVDGNHRIPELDFPQRAEIKGDGRIPAISAASVLAKVFRDRLMTSLDRRYPDYGLAVHKGYGTKVHLEALRSLGPTRMHRLTFRGVRPDEPERRGAQACLPGI